MFTNKSGCTVYEKTVHNRAPTFIRHETGAVYWEDAKSQESGSDRTPQNSVFVSVPVDNIDFVPKVGDKIVCGIIPDLQPPATAMTIMSIEDFRYGSRSVQHWEVTAK